MTTAQLEVERAHFVVRSKAFGDQVVLRAVDATVRRGEILEILGPSGIGKTTLLRIVGGLDTDYDGEVVIAGSELTGPSRNVAFVYQDPALLPWKTIHSNLRFAQSHELSHSESAAQIEHALELVNLDPETVSLKRPSQVSRGMAKRVAIARSIVQGAHTILMDEPLADVDQFTREAIQETIVRLPVARKTEPSILFVTHDVREAVFMADRLLLLSPERPATADRIIEVGVARPRDRLDRRLLELEAEIDEHYRSACETGRTD